MVRGRRHRLLVQVNFLHGSREAPQTALRSIVYEHVNRAFAIVDTFLRSAAPCATAFEVDSERYLAVSNSLTADVRFRADLAIFIESRRSNAVPSGQQNRVQNSETYTGVDLNCAELVACRPGRRPELCSTGGR